MAKRKACHVVLTVPEYFGVLEFFPVPLGRLDVYTYPLAGSHVAGSFERFPIFLHCRSFAKSASRKLPDRSHYLSSLTMKCHTTEPNREPRVYYMFDDSALIYHTQLDEESVRRLREQMEWRFDGTRLFVPGDVPTINEARARRLYRDFCTREGVDPASPTMPVKHLDMSGDSVTQVTTYGEREYVGWVVELGKLRRSSGRMTTENQQRVWYQAAKAFKTKWGTRCPRDVKVAIDSYPDHLRT